MITQAGDRPAGSCPECGSARVTALAMTLTDGTPLNAEAVKLNIERFLKMLGLWEKRDVAAGTFSKGMKQKVAIVRALIHEPEVLFLDEPTLGLDPDVSVRVRAHIAALRRERGMTIVLTTHYMREAEELCDEVAFIKAGRILDAGTPDELKRRIGLGDVIALRLEPAPPAWLGEAPGVLRCTTADGWTKCTVDDAEKRLPDLLRQLFADDAWLDEVIDSAGAGGGALTGLGGMLGMFFGWLVSLAARLVFPSLPTAVPMWALVSGVVVSVGVGLFFGIWPATRAARLDPVVALRYE